MQTFKLTDKAFNGVDGYYHVSFENICTLIAKGIVSAQQAQDVEIICSFNNHFLVGQYEIEAA